MNQNQLLSYLQSGQGKTIPYRPSIGEITGSIKATIFLQQVSYWWANRGGKSFYKFAAPCTHPAYKATDSWLEELCMGMREFTNARDTVSTRAHSQEEIKKLLKSSAIEHCVIYYVDRETNLTWWSINPRAFGKLLKDAMKIEMANDLLRNQFTVYSSPFDETASGQIETAIPVSTYNTPDNNSFFENEKNEEPTESFENFGTVGNVTKVPDKAKKPRSKKTNGTHDSDGSEIPCDFHKRRDIVDYAIELGYDEEIVHDEVVKFKNYYEEKTLKKKNWLDFFLFTWLSNNYTRGNIKRNGKFYKLNANEERLEALKSNLDPDMFAEFR